MTSTTMDLLPLVCLGLLTWSGTTFGVVQKLSFTHLDQTKDGQLLQCEVRGASPQPDVQWQDSAGNNLTAEEPQVTTDGERYDVIVNVTVTKTDTYRCVVTQTEIDHQTQSVITVHIPVPDIKDKIEKSSGSVSSVGWIFGSVLAIVLAVI